MSLRKLVEDYTLTDDPLPRDNIVDIDVEKYKPYYPGVPIGAPIGRVFETKEEQKRRWRKYYKEHGVSCGVCKELLGLDKEIEYVRVRFQAEKKAGRCPNCKTILWDYRGEKVS